MGFNVHIKNNVIYTTEVSNSFSNVYIKVRKKEQRILSDIEVVLLPHLGSKEWRLRKKSTNRFLAYLTSKKTSQKILDIGCGNGWFSNAMAQVSEKNKVTGLDINIEELEQAARVFKKENFEIDDKLTENIEDIAEI